jgi:ABC-type antimicrobial peptide transport system permease subunit
MVHVGDDPARASGPDPASVEIVGVVSTLNDNLFSKDPGLNIYVPFAQQYRSGAYLHVRPRAGARPGFPDRVRAAILEAAPTLPVFGATTFGAHQRSSIEFWGLRSLASVSTSVGLFAALIALIGVYGAKAYAVSRRAREIGVRLAVGASPAGVRRMILAEALKAGAVGVVLGSVLGLAIGRGLAAVLVDLAGFDIWVATLTPALLLAACGAAAWVPALRASRLDPATVLRAD